MKTVFGQSITEYSLVIGIVGLALIGSTSLLGTTLQGQLSNALSVSTVSGTPGLMNPASPPVTSPPVTSLMPLNIPFANLPGQTVTLTLGNGKPLNLIYPNPEAVADAAGNNGVTENALGVLDQVIAQMTTIEIPPQQIEALRKLSEEGHKIQAIQKAIDAALPQGANALPDDAKAHYDYLANNFIDILDPQTNAPLHISLLDAGNMVNSVGYTTPGDFDAFYSFINQQNNVSNIAYFYDHYTAAELKNAAPQSNQLKAFLAQLQVVKDSGILSANPALNSLVKDDLARQIFLSSSKTVFAPDKAQAVALTKTTQVKSNNICSLSGTSTCQDNA